MTRTLILASESPRRKILLQEAGFYFEIFPVNISENLDKNLTLDQQIIAISEQKSITAKMRLLADNRESFLILAADTMVVLDNQALGKPIDQQQAYQYLRQLSGREHQVKTAISFLDSQNDTPDSFIITTRVFFRQLTDQEIWDYIATGEPMDKAGAYGIQGLGRKFVETIVGPFDNVVGLPMDTVKNYLRKKDLRKSTASVNSDSKIIVQKYGGATLSTPEKIKQVSKRIANLSKSGTKVVAVVSAMGKTTNELIQLAHSVSKHPNKREMDMLLSTGERISMSLVSMALHDLGSKSISFTGSQAGIFTNDLHISACIEDVKADRVRGSLDENKIVVLAGFQGVSPKTKEITTLGRGGSDTTAVAMAAYLKANRCEILKDVEAVMSADPKLVNNAKTISTMNYDQLLEMCFWGAKVLHYRSVELAKMQEVTLYIGPAANDDSAGTVVSRQPSKNNKSINNLGANKKIISNTVVNSKLETDMKTNLNVEKNASTNCMNYETSQILSVNSWEQILLIQSNLPNLANTFTSFINLLDEYEIAFPQILNAKESSKCEFYVTGPSEILTAIDKLLTSSKSEKTSVFQIMDRNLCTVTVTHTGTTGAECLPVLLQKLNLSGFGPKEFFLSSQSIAFVLPKNARESAIKVLHG